MGIELFHKSPEAARTPGSQDWSNLFLELHGIIITALLRQRNYEQAEALVFARSKDIPRASLTEFFSYALHYGSLPP